MGSEIVEVEAQSPSPELKEDTLFVALGKDIKESETVLTWALQNSGGKKICILHIHQPAQKISMMGPKVSITLLDEHIVREHHEDERQKMQKILDKYVQTCSHAMVRAEKLHKEMASIEKGIVQLVSEHGIKWLVMGAAANKHYSKGMVEPRSKKAIYVCDKAPQFCHIWFICKGHLIHTRACRMDEVNAEAGFASLPASAVVENLHSSLRSLSVTEGQNRLSNLWNSVSNYRRAHSDGRGMKPLTPSNVSGVPNLLSDLNQKGGDDWDSLSRRSLSVSSHSTCSSSDTNEGTPTISLARTEESENGRDVSVIENDTWEHNQHSPVASNAFEGAIDDGLYHRLEQYVAEAEAFQREAYEESMRRKKAEKEVIDAIRRCKVSETMYSEELRQRKEIEEELARGKEEIKKMKHNLNEIMNELRVAQQQKSDIDLQIAESDKIVEDLEQKLFSAVELLQKYKEEKEELQVERDNALRVAKELRRKQAEEAPSPRVPQFFSEFSFHEIEDATNNFDPELKIGEGGYGSIYRGVLRHTPVAIKMLHPNSSQGPLEFQQEVNILSRLRHPNLVTLIGACPEAWVLVYEYLPNGSLEDRLGCKNNTPPLSWQTRIRIAAEICSILICLHSCRPHCIVHGDLKPANILLDSNLVSKLSDFGICRLLSEDEYSDNNTICCKTEPKGTFVYMDPEFLSTGELTPKSDVYSFGIILLRLLTGMPALRITKEVQYALDKENLKNLLDATAGDWPFVQAKQLAHLAMRCCEVDRGRRPDLALEVWRVLEPMRASCGASSLRLRLGSEEHCQIPSYFVCPIFQEIMQDPVVAADGFTYEEEALKGWLENGHDTSPMTNLKLAHSNLVPNRALRSAIQEWLQQP